VDFKLYNDDCFNVFPLIPDKSVDAIICDLPYGVTDCKWDVTIPFQPLWEEYERVIKDNGAIILTASQPFTTDLINSKRALFRYELIWCKNQATGAFNANKMPMKAHENVLVFYKMMPTYNPIKTKRTEKELKRFMKNPTTTKVKGSIYGDYDRTVLGRDAIYKMPDSQLHYDVVNGRNSKKVAHPTQKPVELMEYLIRTYTDENETVLDNCMGSGTTGVACKLTNRKFIGIEKEPEYFNIAQKRIFETQAGGLFFNSNTSTEL
jgi:site-specific DNA-methyltransferase (adenine-specific)